MADHSILAHLTEKLSQIPSEVSRWVVAYSGGVDSTVLLHSLVTCNQQAQKPRPIIALHINHQLSPDADQWQQHTQASAAALGVEYYAQSVTVASSGKGLEAAARDLRYDFFESFLQAGDALLLGHHQQDQTETLLLRLFRGAGVRGLTAMPESRPVGSGVLIRPFLSLPKSTILDYAKTHQLSWVEDESNGDDYYARNFLRNRVLPSLRERWSAVDEQLTKTAGRMQEAQTLLDEVAEADMQQADLRAERTGFSVSYIAISQLSPARRNNCLRYWCGQQGFPVPDADQLTEIADQFFGRSSLLSSACVSWATVELRQFSGRLYLLPTLPQFFDAQTVVEWDGCSSISLGEAGSLNVCAEAERGIKLPLGTYQIRWRQGGERCTPAQRQHSQTVKKLLQEYALETWLRDRVPLIYSGDELVAVGDLWVNKGVDVTDDQPFVGIYWAL